MGEFKEQKLSPQKLAKAIMKTLKKSSEKLPKTEEDIVNWFNESTLPYKLSIEGLNKEGKNLLAQIKKEHKNKDLSNLSEEELEKLAKTEEGRRLKRLILEQNYPLKTPKSQ